MKIKSVFLNAISSVLAFIAVVLATNDAIGQSYTVAYEEDGFKGHVTFSIDKEATIFKDGLSFKINTNQSKNVIESYQNGKYDAILRKAGVRFPITKSKTSSGDRIDLTGKVYFYMSPQRRNRHSSQPNVSLDLFDAWPKIPEFTTAAKEYVVNYAEKQGTNLWAQTGGLDDLTVKDVYLYELKNKVEGIIKKHEDEQQKLANEKKEQSSNSSNSQYLGRSLGSSISASGSDSKSYSKKVTTKNISQTAYSSSNANHQALNTNNSSTGFYKDPELNRKAEEQRLKMQESQRKIAAMRSQMRRQQEESERLNYASKQTFTAMGNAKNFNDYMNAGKPLINEFAKQGNVGGVAAASAMSIGGGIMSEIRANKAKKEAAEREQAERNRIYEQEQARKRKYEAEQARLRKEAFDLLISQRYTILNAFSDNDPIPLSTTKVGADKIYYFIYATDPSTINTKRTNVYVSNVFEISRYKDGTWPYQSSLETEINELTPFMEVLHGYYLNADDAENMRNEFITSFRTNDGVNIADISYKESSLTHVEDATERQKTTSPANEGLGIKIGPTLEPKQTLPKNKESGSLGIPINM